MVEIELPSKLPILPFRNGVLLPGGIIRIRCTSPTSVRLVEQELWQRDEGNLIGVLPVKDGKSSDPSTSFEREDSKNSQSNESLVKSAVNEKGAGSSEESKPFEKSKKSQKVKDEKDEDEFQSSTNSETVPSDYQKPVGKFFKDPFIWHSRGVAARALLVSRGVEKLNGKIFYVIILEGLCRFDIMDLNARGPYHIAKISSSEKLLPEVEDLEYRTLSQKFKSISNNLISVLERNQRKVGSIKQLVESSPPHLFADVIVSAIEKEFEPKLKLLDANTPQQRLKIAIQILQKHMEGMKLTENTNLIGEKKLLKNDLSSQDDDEDEEDDFGSLEKKLTNAKLPENVFKQVKRELRRLRKMQPQQPGYSSTRNYLEILSDLPWNVCSKEEEINLAVSKDKLDSKHFGLGKVKNRIVEFIAIRKLKKDASGVVLCFVGPPGVGKTSLGTSIASALGRKFVRISLGGVRDEADIRGHRRTYIGSMPGRIIEGIKRAGVNNPVVLLDEIDKMGMDVRGDPSSALLEVLDPEQNKAFADHYLGLPFDLSNVVFVATANRTSSVSPPLLDRMEVIELPGYTPEEKQRIAMEHLIPKVLEQNGLTNKHITFPQHIVQKIIQCYTREAGVRDLSRQIAAIARAAAVHVAESPQSLRLSRHVEAPDSPNLNLQNARSMVEGSLGEGAEAEMDMEGVGMKGKDIAEAMSEMKPIVVGEEMIEAVLGPPKFDGNETAERVVTPGVAVGLVWTTTGGEVQFVEASIMQGKGGGLHLTGQLGDVIKESAQIAFTWVRSRISKVKIVLDDSDAQEAEDVMKKYDIHIHFPAGAVPKDGPSAGVTLVTTLVSLLTQRCVRSDTAMTGELTLRGLTLPVGGIKDKILAAHRYGIRRVILPEKNIKDLKEVPAAILACMEILPTKTVEQVLEEAFEGGSPLKSLSRL